MRSGGHGTGCGLEGTTARTHSLPSTALAPPRAETPRAAGRLSEGTGVDLVDGLSIYLSIGVCVCVYKEYNIHFIKI